MNHNIWRAYHTKLKRPLYVVGTFDEETGLYRYLLRKPKEGEYILSHPVCFYQCKVYYKENTARVSAIRAFLTSSLGNARLLPYDVLRAICHWDNRPRKPRKKYKKRKKKRKAK